MGGVPQASYAAGLATTLKGILCRCIRMLNKFVTVLREGRLKPGGDDTYRFVECNVTR